MKHRVTNLQEMVNGSVKSTGICARGDEHKGRISCRNKVTFESISVDEIDIVLGD